MPSGPEQRFGHLSLVHGGDTGATVYDASRRFTGQHNVARTQQLYNGLFPDTLPTGVEAADTPSNPNVIDMTEKVNNEQYWALLDTLATSLGRRPKKMTITPIPRQSREKSDNNGGFDDC